MFLSYHKDRILSRGVIFFSNRNGDQKNVMQFKGEDYVMKHRHKLILRMTLGEAIHRLELSFSIRKMSESALVDGSQSWFSIRTTRRVLKCSHTQVVVLILGFLEVGPRHQ